MPRGSEIFRRVLRHDACDGWGYTAMLFVVRAGYRHAKKRTRGNLNIANSIKSERQILLLPKRKKEHRTQHPANPVAGTVRPMARFS